MATPRSKRPQVDGSLQVPCKACGAPLVFAISDETGKYIPLDVRSHPIYMLVIHEGVARAKPLAGYVSHFVTCPEREQFSQKGKVGDG